MLLVEDDPDDVELLSEAFDDNNIEITIDIIKEGDKVLSYLNTCNKLPNLVVLDLNLPKTHGKDVLLALKASAFHHIPVVILTTSSAREDIEFCLKAGAEKYITKPSTLDSFNKTVQTLVDVAGLPVEKK